MTPEQSKVKAWMQKAGQDTPDKPTIPSLEVRKLRAKLILEEAFETIENGLGLGVVFPVKFHDQIWNTAINSKDLRFYQLTRREPNLIELADGCADLAVVNLGTACACGIDLEPVFNEVCRSNDSKFVWSRKDLEETVEKLTAIDGDCFVSFPATPGKSIPGEVFYGYVKNASGKLIKPPTYSPANIAPILENQ